MARLFYELIKKELKTIDDVPTKWKKEVEEMMSEDNK